MTTRHTIAAHHLGLTWRVCACLAVLCAALCPVPALAQGGTDIGQLTLDELMALEVDVVYGASRYQQKVHEAGASVTVITSDQIRATGCRTLADVLAAAPSLYVTNDRNYTYLGVRGFARPGDYNSRVLLMVDGHRINDNLYDQAVIGAEFPLDVSLIDRVEIIRGPNSSLYGTSAFLAVVNVITRKARDIDGFTVTGSVGSQAARQGQLTFAKAKPGRSVVLAAGRQVSDGAHRLYYPEFDSPDTANGVVTGADSDESYRLFAAATFGGLTVQALHGTRRKQVPTAAWNTVFGDSRLATEDNRQYVNAQYERSVLGFALTTRGYWDRYQYRGTYPYDDGAGATVLNRDIGNGLWIGGEARLTSPAGGAHRYSLGMEFVRHLRQEQRNFDDDGPLHLDADGRSSDWGVYAQDHYRPFDRLAFDASYRYDRHGALRGTHSPRLAIIYDPVSSTTVKGIYGRVFRYPNAYEHYYADGESQKVNAHLGPETVNTFEGLVDHRIARGVRVSLGGYLSRFDDLIELREDRADGLLQFENFERVTARGVELEVEAKDVGGLAFGRVSYAAQWAETPRSGEALSNAPRHLLKASAALPVDALRVTIAGHLQYASRRFASNQVDAGRVLLTSLNLTRDSLLPGIDVSLHVHNLFGYRYADPASPEHRQAVIPQDGRTVLLRLAYRLSR